MVVRPGNSAGAKRQTNAGPAAVSRPILIGAFVLVALLLVGLAYHYFGPQQNGQAARALTSQEQANRQWAQQKAKESGGDYTRLSPEDQQRLLSIMGPRAPFEFRQMGHGR